MLERILCKQIDSFKGKQVFTLPCGFRKNYKALVTFENDRKLEMPLDNGEKVGVIFMDLSKALGAINHILLLPKLKAYGFSNKAKFNTK